MDIREVAKLADVSIATVSRVVNGKDNVAADTRQRVEKIIRMVDYYPSLSGTHLRTRKTFSIGVVSTHFAAFYHPFLYHVFGETIRGVVLGVRNTKYDIVLARPSTDKEENADYLRLFKESKVDGLVVIYPQDDDESIALIQENGWPVVTVGVSGVGLDGVDVDNTAGVRSIVDHLAGLGHTRIGIINGRSNEKCYRDRLTAFRGAMESRGLAVDTDLVAEEVSDHHDGYTRMEKMLPHKPTAVFCTNDHFVPGIYQAVRAAGLSIPGDIAIAGFSDTPQATALDPALTTVRIPFSAMGIKAAQMLVSAMGDKKGDRGTVVLPGELVVRASTENK